jgi:tight adherence protein B
MGIGWAAALLAAALVVAPVGSRWRPQPRPRTAELRVQVPRSAVLLILPTTVIAGVAASGLRLTTALAGALLAVTVGMRYRAHTRRARALREGRAIVTALEVLVGELRVGAHPVQAFAAAASDVPGPVGPALAAVAARAELGADVPAGLRAVAARSALAGQWERLGLAWELATGNGLPVATLLRAVQTDAVERQRFFAELDAQLAGARATTAILAGLPAIGVLLGEILGARPLALMFGGGFGGGLLVAGTALVCVGLCWADRITAGARR